MMEITIPVWVPFVGVAAIIVAPVVYAMHKSLKRANFASALRRHQDAETRHEHWTRENQEREEREASLPAYWRGMLLTMKAHHTIEQEVLDRYFKRAGGRPAKFVGFTCEQLEALKALLSGRRLEIPNFAGYLPCPSVTSDQLLGVDSDQL